MEFLFKCSASYLTCKCGEQARCKVELYVYRQWCIIYYVNIPITKFLTIFRRYSKSCWKAARTFPNILRTCLKITEDCRRLPMKIRRCFDHTPTNLSTVKGSNMISNITSSISSQWNIYRNFKRPIMAFLTAGNPFEKTRALDNKNK